jgi:hypothetical protein
VDRFAWCTEVTGCTLGFAIAGALRQDTHFRINDVEGWDHSAFQMMSGWRLTLELTCEAAGLEPCCRCGALRGFVRFNDSLASCLVGANRATLGAGSISPSGRQPIVDDTPRLHQTALRLGVVPAIEQVEDLRQVRL